MLAGQASYDELDGCAQVAVRRAWDEQLARDIAQLDLTGRLRAAGRPGAVADDDGNVVWHHPDSPAPE